MGSMVVGFSSAYTSPALVSMRDRNLTSFDVSEQEVSSQSMEFSKNFSFFLAMRRRKSIDFPYQLPRCV